MLEWVAISFSSAWKWKMKVKSLSRVRLLATPWTAAYQAPLSMGFSRQEYWSGVPLLSPGLSLRSPKKLFLPVKTSLVPPLTLYETWAKSSPILISWVLNWKGTYARACCMLIHFSYVWLSVTPWTIAHQAPLSMGFFRQEYWSGFCISSSRGSSQPRDWTCVFCTANRFFAAEPPGNLIWLSVRDQNLAVDDGRSQD